MGELTRIAGQCDGLRCDMAMLVLPEVFERTWGPRAPLFWPTATQRVRERVAGFTFMAEVYWDMEWTTQQQGFDYAYDKKLYDRLREHHAGPVRGHLHAGLDYQDKLARFLENHDESRAAATFSPEVHRAAAAITFLSPGLRFFHQGPFEGRMKRISPHLGRGPNESVNKEVQSFYDRLLAVLRQPVVREGQWQLLECTPGWEGNGTHDGIIAFAWQGSAGERSIVAVNYAPIISETVLAGFKAVIGILGCNLAWAIVDGVMYVLTAHFERGRLARLGREVLAASSDAEALQRIASELDDRLETVTTAEQGAQIHRWALENLRRQDHKPPRLCRQDVLGGIAIAVLIVLATLPVVVPYLVIPDAEFAVRISNLIALTELFLLGMWWGRMVGHSPLRVASGLTLIGLVLVLVAIVLGG